MPLEVVAIDGSTLSLHRSTNGERSPHHENPLLKRPMGETIVVLRGLRNNFGNRELFKEFRRVCSGGAVSPARTLSQHAAMLSV